MATEQGIKLAMNNVGAQLMQAVMVQVCLINRIN
jgi:hypothetical protein